MDDTAGTVCHAGHRHSNVHDAPRRHGLARRRVRRQFPHRHQTSQTRPSGHLGTPHKRRSTPSSSILQGDQIEKPTLHSNDGPGIQDPVHRPEPTGEVDRTNMMRKNRQWASRAVKSNRQIGPRPRPVRHDKNVCNPVAPTTPYHHLHFGIATPIAGINGEQTPRTHQHVFAAQRQPSRPGCRQQMPNQPLPNIPQLIFASDARRHHSSQDTQRNRLYLAD